MSSFIKLNNNKKAQIKRYLNENKLRIIFVFYLKKYNINVKNIHTYIWHTIMIV